MFAISVFFFLIVAIKLSLIFFFLVIEELQFQVRGWGGGRFMARLVMFLKDE